MEPNYLSGCWDSSTEVFVFVCGDTNDDNADAPFAFFSDGDDVKTQKMVVR